MGTRLRTDQVGRIQFALGKLSSGPAATALVKSAADGFATSGLPLIQRELTRAREWQAKHGGPP